MQHPTPTAADWLAFDREISRRSLAEFAKLAWHVLEPATPLKWGWALDAICEHLEAVTAGDLTRLLMNVPPGSMKSLLCGVIWPAYEWGPRGLPHHRFIGTAHSQNLAVRDSMKCRRLIQSQWYQDRWPVALTDDQNAKTKFENDKTGFREAMAFTSMTGSRGDRVILDDPISADNANSDAELENARITFTETLPSRVNNERSAIVVIMQRLNERDTSGVILDKGLPYEHLCIPMRFEVERRCVTGIGWSDPRSEDGELMFADRFPEASVAELEATLGSYASAGQLQQRPAPRGGGMFPVDRFEVTDFPPEPKQILRSVRYWDKAGTQGGGAYTAGVLMHKLKDGRFCVEDVRRGQWAALNREQKITQTAASDGYGVKIWVEQEPGSGGKESAESTVRSLSGYTAHADRVTGDKQTRADPYAAQVQAGNVLLVRGAWNMEFMDEHEVFPSGKYKDQVDAAAGAFMKLASVTTADYAVLGAL